MIKNKALTQKQIKVAKEAQKETTGLIRLDSLRVKNKVNSNSEATIKGKIQ